MPFVMTKEKMVALRVTANEYGRLEEVYRRALDRTLGYITWSSALRELIGFAPMNAITEEDRAYLLAPSHDPAKANDLSRRTGGVRIKVREKQSRVTD
jgi:hypothetical protein